MLPYIELLSLKIPSYGVMMMLGLVLASTIGLFRVHRAHLCWEDAVALIACGFGFAIAGAIMLFLAVTYTWEEILKMLTNGSLFSDNKLGLVFYGGLLGSIPGVLLGLHITSAKPSAYIRALIPCIPLGHAFGRIGCLLAGCCYGVPTEGPLYVIYPQGISGVPSGIPLFPVQALESLLLVGIFVVLVLFADHTAYPFRVVALYLLLYAIVRFGLEQYRFDSVRGHWGILSTSQWISLILLQAGILLWTLPKKWRGWNV